MPTDIKDLVKVLQALPEMDKRRGCVVTIGDNGLTY